MHSPASSLTTKHSMQTLMQTKVAHLPPDFTWEWKNSKKYCQSCFYLLSVIDINTRKRLLPQKNNIMTRLSYFSQKTIHYDLGYFLNKSSGITTKTFLQYYSIDIFTFATTEAAHYKKGCKIKTRRLKLHPHIVHWMFTLMIWSNNWTPCNEIDFVPI